MARRRVLDVKIVSFVDISYGSTSDVSSSISDSGINVTAVSDSWSGTYDSDSITGVTQVSAVHRLRDGKAVLLNYLPLIFMF
jgi:hypothetical protein